MGIFPPKGSDPGLEELRKVSAQATVWPSGNIVGAAGTVHTVGPGSGNNTLSDTSYGIAPDPYRHQTVMLEQLHRVIREKDEQIKKLHEHYGDLSVDSRTGRKRLIEGRLRQSVDTSFQYFDTAYVGDVVHVFLVVNDQTLGLTDEFAMFPSDNLITQLRLLMK